MTSLVQNMVGFVMVSRTVDVPDFNAARFGNTTSIERLSTEPLGTYTQVMKNVVAGSRYRAARVVDNSLATPTANAEGTIPGTPGDIVDHSITLDYYAAGSSNNELVIDVRKGTSAPKYKPFQTFATAAAGTVLAYCAQEADLIA